MDRIHKGLFQGARPEVGSSLQHQGFKLLILCAEEHQPPATLFPGVEVYYAPNDDNFSKMPTRDELRIALGAARYALPILQGGGKVLSTCHMGLNRSGLVSALILHLWLGCDGTMATRMVQRARSGALRNPGFLECLGRLTAKG